MGFDGASCEKNVNDCTENTCLNGGTCVDQVNSFKCECPAGFIGTLCQHNIDDCIKRPCANGGTCFDLVNDYRCMCRPGFKGKDCSIDVNECESNPCRNGASCEDHVDDYTCHCAPCFSGKNCNIRNDDCIYESTFRPVFVYNATQPVFETITIPGILAGVPAGSPEAHGPLAHWQQVALYVSIPLGVAFIIIILILALLLVWVYKRKPMRPNSDLESQQNAINSSRAFNNLRPVAAVQPATANLKVDNEQRFASILKAKKLEDLPSPKVVELPEPPKKFTRLSKYYLPEHNIYEVSRPPSQACHGLEEEPSTSETALDPDPDSGLSSPVPPEKSQKLSNSGLSSPVPPEKPQKRMFHHHYHPPTHERTIVRPSASQDSGMSNSDVIEELSDDEIHIETSPPRIRHQHHHLAGSCRPLSPDGPTEV